LKSKPDKPDAVGILGGSFDPIHNGHLYLAELALKTIPLNKIILIPALLPPHKTMQRITPTESRLSMLRLATRDLGWININEMEINRGGISYTIDTVRTLAEANPGSNLYFIIGSDSLLELWTWRCIREIATRVTFIYLKREDEDPPTSYPELDAELEGTKLTTIPLAATPMNISSTLVRTRVAAGQPITDLVPDPVADYIREHGLYRD